MFRTALLLAAFLACAASASAAPPAPPGPTRAHLQFVIRIPTVLHLRMLQARALFDVPGGAEGAKVVEVADAASFEIRSNMKAYEMRFELADPEVVAVEIEGLDREVRVTREGTSLRFPAIANAERTVRRNLRYRITLAQGARPGPRPMPVMYSLQGAP